MSKKVIQVYGSEDGTVAIATNKKRAWEIAMMYLQNPSPDKIKCLYDKKHSYARFCKDAKDKGGVINDTVYANGSSVSFEEFWLNNY